MALQIAKGLLEKWHALQKYGKKHKPYRKCRYGITDEEFDQLLDAQDGKCKICGTSKWPHRGPCVDHDHTTGRVRGLLCLNCNRGLGAFMESSAILENALKYLISHE